MGKAEGTWKRTRGLRHYTKEHGRKHMGKCTGTHANRQGTWVRVHVQGHVGVGKGTWARTHGKRHMDKGIRRKNMGKGT